MGGSEADLSQALLAAFLTPTGAPRFSQTVVDDALPVFLLALGAELRELSGASQRLVAGFLERAGVTRASTDTEAERALEHYIQAHPLPAGLKQELAAILGGVVAKEFGSTPPAASAPAQRGAPSGASVRAGPLARAALGVVVSRRGSG